jgi:hypothetical protein
VRAEEGAGAVTGLAPTLYALGRDRLERLFVEEGFAAGGARCERCYQLVVGPPCWRCGGASVVPVENVVDAAIGEAFVHHLTLEFCEPQSLTGLGHIGAFVGH